MQHCLGPTMHIRSSLDFSRIYRAEQTSMPASWKSICSPGGRISIPSGEEATAAKEVGTSALTLCLPGDLCCSTVFGCQLSARSSTQFPGSDLSLRVRNWSAPILSSLVNPSALFTTPWRSAIWAHAASVRTDERRTPLIQTKQPDGLRPWQGLYNLARSVVEGLLMKSDKKLDTAVVQCLGRQHGGRET